jgi:hypothetical protein
MAGHDQQSWPSDAFVECLPVIAVGVPAAPYGHPCSTPHEPDDVVGRDTCIERCVAGDEAVLGQREPAYGGKLLG